MAQSAVIHLIEHFRSSHTYAQSKSKYTLFATLRTRKTFLNLEFDNYNSNNNNKKKHSTANEVNTSRFSFFRIAFNFSLLRVEFHRLIELGRCWCVCLSFSF